METSLDTGMRLSDLEEKLRLLKERLLLLGKTFIQDRDSLRKDMQEAKKSLVYLQGEQNRMKELLERFAEQINNTPRREELLILQRQLDLFRNKKAEL